MNNSQGKKKVMFGFDIPSLIVKEAMQRAGQRGTLGGHAESPRLRCRVTSRPGHAASEAGPGWPRQGLGSSRGSSSNNSCPVGRKQAQTVLPGSV